jgi:hypothetical protein
MKRAEPEIVQKYWEWLCKLPKPKNPAVDNDGDRDVEANKFSPLSDEYVFLSFVLSGTSHRNIGTIPQNKKILVPSLSCIASTAELKDGATDTELSKFADIDHDNIEYRRIEIDGKPLVGDLDRFRVRTKPFDGISFPQKAIFNVREGPARAIADGVYIVWEPPIGEHIIHFEGKIDLPEQQESLESRDYVEDVTYTFRVQ